MLIVATDVSMIRLHTSGLGLMSINSLLSLCK